MQLLIFISIASFIELSKEKSSTIKFIFKPKCKRQVEKDIIDPFCDDPLLTNSNDSTTEDGSELTIKPVSIINSTVDDANITTPEIFSEDTTLLETSTKKVIVIKKINTTTDEAIQDEIEKAGEYMRGLEFNFSSTFDNVTFEQCGSSKHPIFDILAWMKATNVYTEYENNKCFSNYHGSCQSHWKSCRLLGAQKLCPQLCNVVSNGDECPGLKNHGYADKERPHFAKECRDNQEFNCDSLRDRGDCLGLALSVSKLCPRACHFCEETRAFLPFSPEAEKISLWLQFFDNGKYAQYARYFRQKTDFLLNKVVEKKCNS